MVKDDAKHSSVIFSPVRNPYFCLREDWNFSTSRDQSGVSKENLDRVACIWKDKKWKTLELQNKIFPLKVIHGCPHNGNSKADSGWSRDPLAWQWYRSLAIPGTFLPVHSPCLSGSRTFRVWSLGGDGSFFSLPILSPFPVPVSRTGLVIRLQEPPDLWCIPRRETAYLCFPTDTRQYFWMHSTSSYPWSLAQTICIICLVKILRRQSKISSL